MNIKNAEDGPAPNHYNAHIRNSIEKVNESMARPPNQQYGFRNTYDKYEKICHKGMEKHFYLREGKGPGAYMSIDHDPSDTSKMPSPFKYSIPSARRPMQERQKDSPGPTEYEPDMEKVLSMEPRQPWGKASRDVPFPKYSSVHKELVIKGL